MNDSCLPEGVSFAMSYVPWQPWGALYDEKAALARGTAFPALDMPFCGGRG